jgi:hypothetical protein
MNPRSKTGERLVVHPHCLMFFVEETGHEEFSDSDFPVFGVCGCGRRQSIKTFANPGAR